MAADLQWPKSTQDYVGVLGIIRDLFDSQAKFHDGTGIANVPTGAIRWSSVANRFEKYNGTAWVALTAAMNVNISGTATLATAVAGGAANQLMAQSGVGATAFVTAPTIADTYLKWNGAAFSWGTLSLTAQNSDGPAIHGLRATCINNAAPNVISLSARAACLRDANFNTVTRYNLTGLTNDVSATGPVANGTDSAASLLVAANPFIYLYLIWNGTTVATLSSATPPSTVSGPVLPTGYTHWCYLTTMALYLNTTYRPFPFIQQGKTVFYQSPRTLVSSTVKDTETTVDLSSLVPPNAQELGLSTTAVITGAAQATNVAVYWRGNQGYPNQPLLGLPAADNGTNYSATALAWVPAAPTGGLYRYRLGLQNGTFSSCVISLASYTVPNGDQ